MSITVYSTGPTCVRCRMSVEVLKQTGVAFDVIDIRTDPRAHDFVTRQLGHSQAPVVVVNDAPAGQHPHEDTTTTNQQHWSGFRPDRLRALGGASNPTTATATTATATAAQATDREQVSAS